MTDYCTQYTLHSAADFLKSRSNIFQQLHLNFSKTNLILGHFDIWAISPKFKFQCPKMSTKNYPSEVRIFLPWKKSPYWCQWRKFTQVKKSHYSLTKIKILFGKINMFFGTSKINNYRIQKNNNKLTYSKKKKRF